MKILKMSSYCYPEQMSSSHLNDDLFDEYKSAGIHTVIYVPTPTRGIDKETRRKYRKIKYEELYDGTVHIHRFAMLREGRNPILRAIRYVLVNIVQYFRSIRINDVDLVFGTSTPPTQGILCAFTAKRLSKKYKRKVPFIYNLQDVFPDSLVTAKMTKKGSLFWKIGRIIEDKTYENADKIIVISEDFKRNIMDKGVPEEKISVIPNWINTEFVKYVPRDENRLFDRYHLDRNMFYICYSGNIGSSQNFDMLLDCAKVLAETHPQIMFVLFGEGAMKDVLMQRIENEKISNIVLLPFQPEEAIPSVFSFGDVGLVISKPGIGNSSVPSKTWGIMAASRPVLASFDRNTELCRILEKNKLGYCIEAGDKDAFINQIKELYMHKDSLSKIGSNARSYVEINLSKDKCTNEYVKLLKTVSGEEHPICEPVI